MSEVTLDPSEQRGASTRDNLSILYRSAPGAPSARSIEPAFFSDLLLDQVIARIVQGLDDYNLSPLFYDHLSSPGDIEYRHEVWRDLEVESVNAGVRNFVTEMQVVRQRLLWSRKTHYVHHRHGLQLDAAVRYCDAVERIRATLDDDVQSEALRRIRTFLATYTASSDFADLARESRNLKTRLATIRFNINLKGPRIRVLKYDGEADYGAEIEEAFERFQQGSVANYLVKYRDWPDMNHVESSIADRVARLFDEEFESLRAFCDHASDFVAPAVISFDRDLHFYLSYLDYIAPMKSRGLSFCLPTMSDSKGVSVRDTFDIALANKLVAESKPVVCNEFHLAGHERIFVVSGPNQGGKTTFARTFGQIHFLGALGCPVPGHDANLFLFDDLFTHFGREEDATFQSGKLEDDLLRIQKVLRHMTPNSIVIMNEIFSSTTTQDALSLGTKVLERVIAIDALCVVVSFIDELTLLGPSIVSMTSSVNPDDPVERTFKVIRHPADGLAYAISIAEKYGLTYEQLRERISS